MRREQYWIRLRDRLLHHASGKVREGFAPLKDKVIRRTLPERVRIWKSLRYLDLRKSLPRPH
jgi:hypothetical protein